MINKFKIGDKVRLKEDFIEKDYSKLRLLSDYLEFTIEEYEEITPENIAEVLEYNGITNCKKENYPHGSFVITPSFTIGLDHSNWLQHLELELGKLKPLPKKKEPTLKEALVELGFKKVSSETVGWLYNHEKNRISICIYNAHKIFIGKYGTNFYWKPLSELITYTTKEQLAKDIAAFKGKYKKESTFEEALLELGFKKEDGSCCHTRGRIAICTGQYKEIRIPGRYEATEDIIYTTKEQLIKDITEFEKKNRPHWSLIDDGGHGKEIGKLYLDEIIMSPDGYYLVDVYLLTECIYITDFFVHQPTQHQTKISDFGILLEDGSLIKAFWKGSG